MPKSQPDSDHRMRLDWPGSELRQSVERAPDATLGGRRRRITLLDAVLSRVSRVEIARVSGMRPARGRFGRAGCRRRGPGCGQCRHDDDEDDREPPAPDGTWLIDGGLVRPSLTSLCCAPSH